MHLLLSSSGTPEETGSEQEHQNTDAFTRLIAGWVQCQLQYHCLFFAASIVDGPRGLAFLYCGRFSGLSNRK